MMNKFTICNWLVFSFLLFNSCTKPFDTPPENNVALPNANTTIRNIKLLHVKNNFEKIMDDFIIQGIVIANDKSGNWYKQIIIQDESGGIVIRMDANNLYTNFQVGRKVAIKLKDLYLGDYGGVIQLGMGIDNADPNNPTLLPIPMSLFDKYIIKGSFNNVVAPKSVNINAFTTNLQDTLQSTLIQLDNVEFSISDIDKTFADALNKQALNLTIKNCSGNTIALRSSGYADFASFKVPTGNGKLIAVYSIFGNTKQLFIRDTLDVNFQNPRCGNAGITKITISELRNIYSSTPFVFNDNKLITGIVITDAANGNIASNEMVVQENNNGAGIVVRLKEIHHYKLGDSLSIFLKDGILSKENGILVLKNIDSSAIQINANTKTIEAKQMTIQQLKLNAKLLESNLIQISYPVLNGSVWNEHMIISDVTGTINCNTLLPASFYNVNLPSQPIKTITGWLSFIDTLPVLYIRNLNDVELLPPNNSNLSNAIYLNTSPLVFNFNDIGNGLPTGCFVYTNATNNSLGTVATFNVAKTSWGNTSGGFKNCASALSLSSSATSSQQDNATNRAIALRQTSTGGFDPGAAFVLHLANTLGKKNLQISFQLQSLDVNSARTTNWVIEYGLGETPNIFNQVPVTGNLFTGNSQFSSQNVLVNFNNLLNNVGSEIWIRIVAKTATSGTGSRPVSAIDDLVISWND